MNLIEKEAVIYLKKKKKNVLPPPPQKKKKEKKMKNIQTSEVDVCQPCSMQVENRMAFLERMRLLFSSLILATGYSAALLYKRQELKLKESGS